MAASGSSLRRLTRDLRELEADPVPGASLIPIDDNLYKLHCNLIIPSGPYTGLLIHFILNIPDTYPYSSPAGSMPDGFPFGQRDHAHIHGVGLCNDYLSNYSSFFKVIDGGQIQAGSGWTPAVTLKMLLMIMKQFFAEIDMSTPSKSHVDHVFASVAKFVCTCGHTADKPHPPITSDDATSAASSADSPPQSVSPIEIKTQRARDNLICSFSKLNYIQDGILLGYPISLRRDSRDRLWLDLHPELISYEQIVTEIQRAGVEKLYRYDKISFRTASGHSFNHWLPIYINEAHFQGNITCIENTVSVLSKRDGVVGKVTNDFRPSMVLQVLPCLINKMVVAIMNGSLHSSENAIFAYCHYVRLLLRFLEKYPRLVTKIDRDIERFISGETFRCKSTVPDIGEFLIKLMISKKYNFYDPSVQTVFMKEYIARQVFWVVKKYPSAYVERDFNKKISLIFSGSDVSNKLLVYTLTAAKYFMCEGIEERLDACYGIPPDAIVTAFQSTIAKIKDIKNYRTWLQAISLDKVITSPALLEDLLFQSYKISKRQGYT
jgi:ubiquitin-protein ligase